MAPMKLPVCCSPGAFELLSKAAGAIDSPDALLSGAVAIAMHQMDEVDAGAVEAALVQGGGNGKYDNGDGGDGTEPMLVDAFAAGRILTPDEAQTRLQEMFGPEAEWSEEMLRPASNRHWLTRMLQNLLNVFGS